VTTEAATLGKYVSQYYTLIEEKYGCTVVGNTIKQRQKQQHIQTKFGSLTDTASRERRKVSFKLRLATTSVKVK
jgi:hypothetical protein